MNVQPRFHRKSFAVLFAGMALSLGLVGVSQGLAATLTAATASSAQPSQLGTQQPVTQKQQTLQVAQRSRVRRIEFEPGASSAILKDAVVRGTQDVYLVGASKGQTMTIKISSLENNGAFELLAPANSTGKRRSLKVEAASWAGVLPASGDYQIVVGSTRGNSSYQLKVAIR